MQFLKVGELWQDHETQLQVSFIRLFWVICIPKSFFKRWILNMPLRIIIHSNLLKATYLALAWLIENFWLIYYIYQVWKVQTYTNVLIHFSPPCICILRGWRCAFFLHPLSPPTHRRGEVVHFFFTIHWHKGEGVLLLIWHKMLQ